MTTRKRTRKPTAHATAVAQVTQSLGRGIVTIPYEVLRLALPLPDGFQIAAIIAEPYANVLRVIVDAPNIPSAAPGMPLPEIDVHVTEDEREGHIYRTAISFVRPPDAERQTQPNHD